MRRLLYPLLLAISLIAIPGVRAEDAVISFLTPDSKKPESIVITLFAADAPRTVANFVKLAKSGFYNKLAVHRIVPETLVQMGDPLSKNKGKTAAGTGGPGYTLPAEIHHKHVRGAVAMAGLPSSINPARDSNGSQFYICLRPQPQLDSEYTVFGEVKSGFELLEALSKRSRDTNDAPTERIVIHSVEIKP